MDHPEFGSTGLKVSSVIRLDKVSTILKDMIVGEVGEIGASIIGRVNAAIRELYLF
jgi:mRNA interferase MazF